MLTSLSQLARSSLTPSSVPAAVGQWRSTMISPSRDGWRYPFLSKLEALVMSGRISRPSLDVWNSLAFYNYIPVVAANEPRKRPPRSFRALKPTFQGSTRKGAR